MGGGAADAHEMRAWWLRKKRRDGVENRGFVTDGNARAQIKANLHRHTSGRD